MDQLPERGLLRTDTATGEEMSTGVLVVEGADLGVPLSTGQGEDKPAAEDQQQGGCDNKVLISEGTALTTQVIHTSLPSGSATVRPSKPPTTKTRSSVPTPYPPRTEHTMSPHGLISNNMYYRCVPVQITAPGQPVYYSQPSASATTTRPHHQQPGMQGSEQLSSTNLYIRGLSRVCSDEDLMQLCKGFGKIVSTKSILDKNTSLCKGYGFVDFESPSDAMRACQSLQGQGIIVQFAKVPQQEQDPTNLYISNLPSDFDEKMIENLLAPYGKIVSTRILRDQSMNSRGVGFARMDTKEACDEIIKVLNGAMLPGSKEPLMIKFADSTNKKKQAQNRWRDQQQYIYEATQVIPQTGLVGSRGLVQTGVFTAPYVQTTPQPIQGYQVPVSTISGGWSPATTYFVPTGGVGSADSVHALGAQMSGLQIASTTGYMQQPSNQYHFTNQAGTTYAQPSQGSWNVSTGTYLQQDPSVVAVEPQSGSGDKHQVQVISSPTQDPSDDPNVHLYYPTSTWSGK